MLEMAASVWLANSKKFSTHVDEPAFGTLSIPVKIMDEDDWTILFGNKMAVMKTLHQARLWRGEWKKRVKKLDGHFGFFISGSPESWVGLEHRCQYEIL